MTESLSIAEFKKRYGGTADTEVLSAADFAARYSSDQTSEEIPEKKGFGESFLDRGIETAKGIGSLGLSAGQAMVGYDPEQEQFTNPLETQAKFLPGLASNMYKGAAADREAAMARQFEKNSPLRTGIAAFPVAGPYLMNAVSDIEEGKGAEVAGRTTFDALTAMLPTKPGMAVAGKAAKGAKGAAQIAKDVAVGAYKGTKRLNAGDAIITTMANMAGPKVAAATGTFMLLKRTLPGIAAEVRKGWAKRNPGLSGAKLEGALNNLPPQELAWAIDDFVPESVAKDIADPAPKTSKAPADKPGTNPIKEPAPTEPKPVVDDPAAPKVRPTKAEIDEASRPLAEALGQDGVAPQPKLTMKHLKALIDDPNTLPKDRIAFQNEYNAMEGRQAGHRAEGRETKAENEAAGIDVKMRHRRGVQKVLEAKEEIGWKIQRFVAEKWLDRPTATKAFNEGWDLDRLQTAVKSHMEGNLSGLQKRAGESKEAWQKRILAMEEKR